MLKVTYILPDMYRLLGVEGFTRKGQNKRSKKTGSNTPVGPANFNDQPF